MNKFNTDFFKVKQIETTVELDRGGTGDKKEWQCKLIIMHQCGEDSEAVIEQLEKLIEGYRTNFKDFGDSA